MPKFKLKAKNRKSFERLKKAVEETVIVQRQESLTPGHWDFAVFGPAGKDETILRVGYAEYGLIHRAPVYIASLAEPGWMNGRGMPIEEFIGDDIPEEYRGLEIYQVDPVRPLTVSEKKTLPAIGQSADTICKEYKKRDIAVIRAPHESDWAISVMRYLHECDRHFPDRVQVAFRAGAFDVKGEFVSFPGLESPKGFLN